MHVPRRVKLVEVGPRDGLQNEAVSVPAPAKIELIERLAEAGLTAIEAGAFVSPKWVPQMADTEAVYAGLKRRPGVSYPAIAFNLQGLARAKAAGVGEVAVGSAASEAFTRKNTNCTIAESLERAAEVCAAARADDIRVRGYVSCVLGCPYEGETKLETVAAVAARLLEMGCYEISLGDTIGVGTPAKAAAMVDAVAARVPRERLAIHFHDTYGQALANALACLERGIAVIDSSVAGLGGCPYAAGASGNVATEDVLFMLNGLGVTSGVDLEKVAAAGRFICGKLGRAPASRVAQALLGKRAA
jgi:isopropylmalate/homocitrate/citramalate synthase